MPFPQEDVTPEICHGKRKGAIATEKRLLVSQDRQDLLDQRQ